MTVARTRIAVYPGTFDPITNGHVDLIDRAAPLVRAADRRRRREPRQGPGAAAGAARRGWRARRWPIIRTSKCAASIRCSRISSTEIGGGVLLRGLRAVSDFEYEFQLASMNRHLIPEVETLFLTPAEQYGFISSSLVREISRLGGDVSGFVPPAVAAALQEQWRLKTAG